MIVKFFDDPKHFHSLMVEVMRWKGTPYSDTGVCQPQVGTDCVRWIHAALIRCGAIKPVALPEIYGRRNSSLSTLGVIMGIMDSVPQFQRSWKAGDDAALPLAARGQVLVISSGTAVHHLAIVGEPPVVWHCMNRVGEANWFDGAVRNNVYAVYEVVTHV